MTNAVLERLAKEEDSLMLNSGLAFVLSSALASSRSGLFPNRKLAVHITADTEGAISGHWIRLLTETPFIWFYEL